MERSRRRHAPVLVLGILLVLGAAPAARSGPGNLDVRFGTHGQAEVPGQFESAAMVALPDGRILIFGVPDDTATHEAGAIALARMRADGTPDSTFGSGGSLHLPLGADVSPVPTDALLLPDGQVLVAGYFAGGEFGDWPQDEAHSAASGWLLRLSADGVIDTSFGTAGMTRAIAYGIDRITRFDDGTIMAAGSGLLQRLDANGVPEPFDGVEASVITLGTGYYRVTALAPRLGGNVITTSGYTGPMDNWYPVLVSVSGNPDSQWTSRIWRETQLGNGMALARAADDIRWLVCGVGPHRSYAVERWGDDGRIDATFASSSGGLLEVGADRRPVVDGLLPLDRYAQCRAMLRRAGGDYVVAGDKSRAYEYGGGRVLLGHFGADGALDPVFGSPDHGLELALGGPEVWSSWQVTGAELAPDGALLLIAHRSSAAEPGSPYYTNALGPQRTVLARVEIDVGAGAGAIGFNDAALRISERASGELRVYRTGGRTGAVSVQYELVHDTTDASDIVVASGTSSWPDGDDAPHSIPLVPVDDDVVEGEETFRIRLSAPTGGAVLGAPEIEVTIEDDEALRALQFAESAPRVVEGNSLTITLQRPAATAGPIVVHYALAEALDSADGSPQKAYDDSRVQKVVGTLHWDAADTTDRTLVVSFSGSGVPDPDVYAYLALADTVGTLSRDGDWKALPIVVENDPALENPPPPPSPPPPTPQPSSSGGGGALSFELLALLAALRAATTRRARRRSK